MPAVPPAVRPRLLDLSECPHCASPFVQATDWRALPSGRVALAMRCPECLAWMSGTFSAERVRQLDRALSSGRSALRAVYERTLRENMEGELRKLRTAFELDLVGPDDFVVGQERRARYQA